MAEFKSKKELFLYIWETRPHVSEITGEPLLNINHPKWHWQFLHVLAHGHYPSYKFKPENIMLALPEEHDKQEDYPVFIDRQDELRRQYYKEIYGKEF